MWFRSVFVSLRFCVEYAPAWRIAIRSALRSLKFFWSALRLRAHLCHISTLDGASKIKTNTCVVNSDLYIRVPSVCFVYIWRHLLFVMFVPTVAVQCTNRYLWMSIDTYNTICPYTGNTRLFIFFFVFITNSWQKRGLLYISLWVFLNQKREL